MLPADEEEVRVRLFPYATWHCCVINLFLFQRSELQHKTIQFLFSGKNYVGPIADILRPKEGQERCRVLDLGTGGGFW
jgi:hypothetical protein